ncbi:M48 family metallopeptidase [Streptomyces sp. NBC_00691]|uniref:M48 family metallopeptidase n=1 Tax=Streptomyces sp. NBC_00691 TaxID=2903671 RepID=UPI002E366963|nr:M48 family metallopeptidase [Streptomyces sp. NBC_00691]
MTETAHAVATAIRDCPECGAPVADGGRYVSWCAACDWNVDPEVPDEQPPGRVERLRRRLAQRGGEQLLAELTEFEEHGESGPPAASGAAGASGGGGKRRGTAGGLAAGLAAGVHGVTLALLVGGLWLIVAGWGENLLPAFGALGIGLALVLRPRFARLPKADEHRPVLRRPDAPRLFALLDEVAASVGTTGVDVVVIDADANASVSSYGVRQRRMLHIGLGLWEILTPQERIALLGHEFGHYSHGDTRRTLLVRSALHSLDTWRYTLAPQEAQSLTDTFVNVVTAPPRLLVDGLLVLLEHLTLHDSQRAEYRADTAAARAAGTDAAAGLMDRLLIADGVAGELARESVAARTRIGGARRDDPAEGLWERLAAHAASVPEREYERLRRVAERRGHQVDSTHPPTHLRHRRLTRGARVEPGIVCAPTRVVEVDTELAEVRRSVARALVRR